MDGEIQLEIRTKFDLNKMRDDISFNFKLFLCF